MQTRWVDCLRRVRAPVLIAGLGVALATGFSPAVMAGADAVPVPPRKPAAEKVSIIRYSLKDMAKALFGSGPQANEVAAEASARGYDGPLLPVDAARYARIFDLQAEGRMDEAGREIASLGDTRLRGHILYQRYMHPDYTTTPAELAAWLKAYNDHPGAARIHQLALRKGADGSALKKPRAARGVPPMHEPVAMAGRTYQSPAERSKEESASVAAFKKTIADLASRNPHDALNRLQSDKAAARLDDVEKDILQAKIATKLLHRGRIDEAYKIAARAADRSGVKAPQAGWVAGLVSWQRGNYKRAAKYFEMMAASEYASGWSVSGASYWAARAHMRAGNVRAVSKWLEKAAAQPRTFYGLVATRALGRDFEFNWHVPTFTKAYLDVLNSTPAGRRAVALMAAGQPDLAQAELLRLDPRSNDDLRDALLAYAAYARLPALAMRIGGSAPRPYDAALYPMGPWQPRDGYKVDPALIYAIMRQESRFDPDAQSPRGAQGLMQLMPATAKAVARRHGGGGAITDPETNLALGQKYIETLLKDRNVKNDMLSLLIAYNAGPGNLSRWKKTWPDVQDPLLFIELIPAAETRSYVERVLANYWIYRLREGLSTPSLDAVAAGRPARYAGFNPADIGGFRLAAAE